MSLCTICGKNLNSPTECAWTSCPKLFNPDWDESRIDIIGQNGNDGDHYEIEVDTSNLTTNKPLDSTETI